MASSEVEETNNMIKGLTIEAEAPQEEEEGMTMVITVTAIPTTLEIEVDPSKDVQVGCVVSNQEEEGYALQAGTGDPEYRGILQYKYICGICRNKGHYDHQCHTLQHLAHALQSQQATGLQPCEQHTWI